jgi:hypothetical protein
MFTHTFDNGTKTAVINPDTGVVSVTPSGRTYGFPSEVVIEDRQRVFKNYQPSVFKELDFNRIEMCKELGPDELEGALFMNVHGNGVTFKETSRPRN